MKDMISLTSAATGARVAVRASEIAIVLGPAALYGSKTNTTIRLANKVLIEVRESYDTVWRLIDGATMPDQSEKESE